MNLREELERLEHEHLDPKAAFADESRGRLHPEEPRAEDVRTVFQRDVDKIVHSKAFRRLMHKTQVFLSPEGDHYRTRMTHTIEVSRIARTIAKALNLNEDLAEAMDALDIQQADVLAVSQGGMIAQYLAMDRPDLVNRMVLAVTLSRNNAVVTNVIGNWIQLTQEHDWKSLVADIVIFPNFAESSLD